MNIFVEEHKSPINHFNSFPNRLYISSFKITYYSHIREGGGGKSFLSQFHNE